MTNTPNTPDNTPRHDSDESAARVRRHLEAATDNMALTPMPIANVKDRADQRTARRQRAVAVGLVAAASIGVVGGIATLTRSEPDRVITSSSPEGGTGDTTVGTTGQSSSTEVPTTEPVAPLAPDTTVAMGAGPGGYGEDLFGELSAAQQADPAFVWKVVEAGKESSINGSFGYGFDSTFPTFALSTAPGRSNDYDNIETFLYRSEDGISWNRTEAQAPFSSRNYWNATMSDDQVFVTGTAPGIAKTQPNPLQIAVSDGVGWTIADLGIDTNAKPDLPMVEVSGPQINSVPYGLGVLVVVTEQAYPDYRAINEATGGGPDEFQIVDQQADGVALVSTTCMNSMNQTYDPASELFGPADGLETVPSTTPVRPITDGADFYGCDVMFKSWTDLGMPNESIAALSSPMSRFFTVSPALEITEIDAPAEGGFYTIGTGEPIVEQAPVCCTESMMSRYELVDDAWVEIDPEVQSALTSQGAQLRDLGGRRVGLFGSQFDGRVPFMSISDDGTTNGVDLQSLLPAGSTSWSELATAAGSQWVGTVQSDVVPAAAEGGSELRFGDVIVRMIGQFERFELVDAESGEPIDRALVTGTDDGTIEVHTPDGAVRATFNVQEIYSALQPSSDVPMVSTKSIVTTGDGVSFSVESVASLLGLADADVSRVARIASDGTTVIVTVTLTDRYPDETPKQLVLVGTPIG